MKKRASGSAQTGARGQTAVKLAFEEMQWGPIPVTEHDDGTDFYVQVRDPDLTTLSLLLGVQVKSEASYFKPQSVERAMKRQPAGWFYKARQADVRYWLDHAVPHVLALCDASTQSIYWGHVSPDGVRFTPKGATVWIPASNQLDLNARDELQRIASTARGAPLWTGSSWDGVDGFPASERLRVALVTPRVAAPHPNKSLVAVEPEEALAALMMCRYSNVRRWEASGLIPSEADRLANAQVWGLFDELRRCLSDNEWSPPAVAPGPDNAAHIIAATVALRAGLLLERGQVDAALSLVESVDLSVLDAVDRSWMQVHHARCLIESERLDEARLIALDAAAVGVIFPSDATAAALRAAALALVDECDWPQSDASMIRATDSAPVWWRGEQRGWALSSVLNAQFRAWATTTSSDQDADDDESAWRRLRSLTLTAGATGDARAWRTAMSQLACFTLLRLGHGLSDNELAQVIQDLRLSGATTPLADAASKLVEDGPMSAVAIAVQQLDLARSTRTSRNADLKLLYLGADCITAEDADRHGSAALARLKATLDRSTRPSSWMDTRGLVDALKALWPHMSAGVRTSVIDYVVCMPAVEHTPYADWYRSLVSKIRAEDWGEDHLALIRKRLAPSVQIGSQDEGLVDHEHLLRAWRWVLGQRGDSALQDALQTEVSKGSLDALVTIRRFDAVQPEAVKGLITHLGAFLVGPDDTGRVGEGLLEADASEVVVTLFRLNLAHPHLADWEPIGSVLAGRSGSEACRRLLHEIASDGHRAPTREQAAWRPLLTTIAENPEPDEFGISRTPPVDVLAGQALFALINPLEDATILADRLASGPDGRGSVATAIGRHGRAEHVLVLAALAVDDDPAVQAEVAAACVRWLLRGGQPEACDAILKRLLSGSGRRLAAEAMRAIPHQPDLSPVDWVLQTLATHPSSGIRRRAINLLAEPAVCRCDS